MRLTTRYDGEAAARDGGMVASLVQRAHAPRRGPSSVAIRPQARCRCGVGSTAGGRGSPGRVGGLRGPPDGGERSSLRVTGSVPAAAPVPAEPSVSSSARRRERPPRNVDSVPGRASELGGSECTCRAGRWAAGRRRDGLSVTHGAKHQASRWQLRGPAGSWGPMRASCGCHGLPVSGPLCTLLVY